MKTITSPITHLFSKTLQHFIVKINKYIRVILKNTQPLTKSEKRVPHIQIGYVEFNIYGC